LFGVVVPVLQDAGESSSNFGQLVISDAMFAEFGSIILLSLFFSRQANSTVTKLVLLASPLLCSAWSGRSASPQCYCDCRTPQHRFACAVP
jgi:Kef-type K+ transport system membrane component KefB